MAGSKSSNKLLVLIGIGKLLKATLLIFFALEMHRLLGPKAGEKLVEFFLHLRVDPGNRHVHELIARVTGVRANTLHTLRIGSYLYATLFAIEGLGLVLRQRWAEYVTVVTTSLLLPLEVYEIFRGKHLVPKLVLLLLNLAIVFYLVWQLWKTRHEEHAHTNRPARHA